jgi:2-polyprenyl-3-methyl-5-hydroxy-6-metoxy-1,4-benzoquinol methylase
MRDGVLNLQEPAAADVQERARKSRGTSDKNILEIVLRALDKRQIRSGCLVDVGCGAGDLYLCLGSRFEHYIGADVIRYDSFPADAQFCRVDLDTGRVPIPEGTADVVAAVEVIEHLENPRSFVRELVRLARPGGWVIVTTPNQLSFLSLITLIVKRRFQAFQDVHYPTHITALLEIDLIRIARECGLRQIEVEYSLSGRIPLTGRHYPRSASRVFPRALSENLLMIGRKTDTDLHG